MLAGISLGSKTIKYQYCVRFGLAVNFFGWKLTSCTYVHCLRGYFGGYNVLLQTICVHDTICVFKMLAPIN